MATKRTFRWANGVSLLIGHNSQKGVARLGNESCASIVDWMNAIGYRSDSI